MDHDYSNAIRFSQLPSVTGGKTVSFHRDITITDLVLDSRKTTASPGRVFFAIKGERHNGHDYINALYRRGIQHFVVEQMPDDPGQYPEGNFLQVQSSINALQSIAAFHRSHFNLPVVGITGSNGKTIIKEWLFQLLSRREAVVKNPGSYNSQIGVPLSVWQIGHHHTIGIFEAGISKPGEMEKLQAVIRPTLGVFSNIGSAHNEAFHDEEQKVREKLKLFTGVENLIYCRDHTRLHGIIQDTGIRGFTWGFSEAAEIHLEKTVSGYSVQWQDQVMTIDLPFKDAASVENCFHVIAVLLFLGYDTEYVRKGIQGLKTVPMRLELKEGINHCQIVDDTYNNDLAGIEMSLQFLSHQPRNKKKTLILSDVLESGLEEKVLAGEIATLVEKHKIDRFIGVGPLLVRHASLFHGNTEFFETTNEFLKELHTDTFYQEAILVKGARIFEFEKITKKLQRKIHGTIMEIDLGALVYNFNHIKSRLKKSTRVMVMVKAFAYGSGSNEVASLLQFHQADYLGVAYPDEGVELRKNNITLPVMVMNSAEESFDQLLAFDLEPEIYSFRVLKHLIDFLNGRSIKVHLKLDTGMRRLGFEEQDLGELKELLTSNRNLSVASIFSHLAGADEAMHDGFSDAQAKTFERTADLISIALGYKPLYHLLNSPGILRLPQFQHDMVRLGIGLYGVDPTDGGLSLFKPVATLKSIISQIKKLRKGETVGYGRRGVAERDMMLATIAIGYADGYSRAFSAGVGKVLVNGNLAPVIGNVCMDMTMIDITGIHAEEGDEVVIFGKDLPIQKVAHWGGTIPYEILTSTSERVKRVFIAESL